MESPHSNNKTLKVTIHLRNGTTSELSENVLNGSGDVVDTKQLSAALRTLQTRTNNELTALVEKERDSTAANGQKNNTNDEDDAEDDDVEEDDDDDDDDDTEPPKKQQKR